MIDLRIVLGLLLMVFVGGIWTGINVTENDVATVKIQAANERREALEQLTQLHNKRVTELEKINNEALTELERLNADHAVTVNAGDSLQQQYAASLCKPASKSTAASTITDGAADATTSLVQSYVFNIVNQRAIALAKIADESRLRGLTCEAEYVAAVRF
jgi:hypothetical protein